MENISNNSSAFNSNLISNKSDSSKNDFRNLNEEHTLSLRKKRNNSLKLHYSKFITLKN